MSAKLYFYFKKNPLQFIQVSGLNIMVNNEKTFNIKANIEVEYEITPGKCKIQMSMPYLGSETGIANIDLDVKDGDRIVLTYKSPITVFTNGTILVDKKNCSNYANLQDCTSDRGYKTIKVFEPKEWLGSCPIKIEKEQLLLDNQKNQIILQIKLFNLSKKNIRAVYMNVECFDDAMDYVTKYNDISYQALDVLPKSSFGNKQHNYFKELNIANVKIIINKVVFTDSEVWRNDKNEVGILLPKQKSIDKNDVLYGQVLREFKEKQIHPIFWFESNTNYWRCTCGQTNLNDDFKCCYCNIEKEFLSIHLNKNYLEEQQKKHIEFIQRKNEEKLKVEEETKKLLEQKDIIKQKKGKLIKAISLIVIIIIMLYIFVSMYIHVSLSELVEDRNIGKIERVLKLGKDINEVDKYGETALYSAVSNSDEEISKYLIEKGANVNYIDLHGYSILENAINRNNENIIRYLVENKANVNFVDTNGHSMLEIAINIGNSNVIQYLIDNNSNINFVNKEKVSILEMAISKDDIKIIESLIKSSANINYISDNNESILANAIISNNEDLVKLLVQNGADVNYMNSSEKSILQIAMGKNNNSIINYLIENGAKKTGKYIDIISGVAIEKIEIKDKIYDGTKFCEFTTKNITKNNINYIKYGIGFYKDSVKVDSREYVWDLVIKAGESNKMTSCNTQPSTVDYDEVKITIIEIN